MGNLDRDEIWYPLPDSHPCGPHLGVLAKGRVMIELPPPKAQGRAAGVPTAVPVMALESGSLFLEGLAAEYGTVVRAEKACEAYRIRQCDFLAAVSGKSGKDWLPRFRMLEGQMRKQLQTRANSARGIKDGLARHPHDAEIH